MQLHFVSYNVNGIRAALTKGLADWIAEVNPDVLAFQEIKATPDQLAGGQVFADMGYVHQYWLPAEKKGYSGVAVVSKVEASQVVYGMGNPKYDVEGRLLRLDFGDLTFINTYMPSGTTGDERQQFKYEWLDDFYAYIQQLRASRPKVVVCGDFNICHREIDIHNPVSNKNSSGFLPEERAWVGKLLQSGFTDTFRFFNQEPHHYTWWTYRAGARKKNLGWRIDYFIATENLNTVLQESPIYPDAMHSDHCPIGLKISMIG
jgi:exodeoxyribonuclease-3